MTAMTPDKVEAALGAELCVLNHCTEPCEFHRRWASRLAAVITSALAEAKRDAVLVRGFRSRLTHELMRRFDLLTYEGARIEAESIVNEYETALIKAAIKDTDHAR